MRCGHEELPADNNPPHHLINDVINPLLNRLFDEDNEAIDDDDDGGEEEEEMYFDSDDSEDFASAESDLGYLEHPINYHYLHDMYGHSDMEDADSNSSWITEEEEVIIGADDTCITDSWTIEAEEDTTTPHHDMPPPPPTT